MCKWIRHVANQKKMKNEKKVIHVSKSAESGGCFGIFFFYKDVIQTKNFTGKNRKWPILYGVKHY